VCRSGDEFVAVAWFPVDGTSAAQIVASEVDQVIENPLPLDNTAPDAMSFRAFAVEPGAVTLHCDTAGLRFGGSASTVKLAKADLVPKDTNLLAAYASFAELEAACGVFREEVNTRIHRVTRRTPAEAGR
jgi:hypothetical protein